MVVALTMPMTDAQVAGGVVDSVLPGGVAATTAQGAENGTLATTMNIGGPVATFQNSTFVLNGATEQVLQIDDQTDLATIIAGNGESGFSGDGGPALDASFRFASNGYGIAVDSTGGLVINDTNNYRLRYIASNDCTSSCPYGLSSTTAGDIYTVAGNGQAGISGDGGPATAAEIDSPNSLSLDATGDIIFSSQNDLNTLPPPHVNPNVQLVAANNCSANCPFGLSEMTAGDIYLIAGTGALGYTGDDGPATAATFKISSGNTAIDSRGDIVVDDDEDSAIRVVAAFSCSSTCPYGLGAMTAGEVYTIAGGKVGAPSNGESALAAPLYVPLTVGIDPSGDVFMMSYNTVASEENLYMIAASNCASSCPFGLATTTTGAIYDLSRADPLMANEDSGPAISPNGDLIYQTETNLAIGRAQDVLLARNSCSSNCLFGLPQVVAGADYVIAGDISGSINGTVTYGLTTAAENLCVYAQNVATGVRTMSQTQSNGTYFIGGLAPGNYLVEFDPTCVAHPDPYPTEWYNGSGGAPGPGSAAAVNVNTSPVLGIDEALPLAATITGTVTESGSAVGNVCVTAYADDSNDGGNYETGSATTAANGTYTISSLPEDTYIVLFDPTCADNTSSDLDILWYDGPAVGEGGAGDPPGGESKGDATAITAIQNSSGPVSSINAGLSVGATVEGTISAPQAAGTAGICVTLLNPGTGENLYETSTSSEGAYEFTHLPAGTYKVEVDPTCGATLASEYGATTIPTFNVSNSQSEVENATLPVTSSTPSITTNSLAPATQGSLYTTALTAAGGLAPYSWLSNALPTGLGLNSQTGVLSGVPADSGSYTVTVGAIDHSSPPGEAVETFTLTISAPSPTTTTTVPTPTTTTTTTTLPASSATTTTVPSPVTTTLPATPSDSSPVTTTTVQMFPATTSALSPATVTTTTSTRLPTGQPSISLLSNSSSSDITNGTIKERLLCHTAKCSGTATLTETLSVKVLRNRRVVTVQESEVVGSGQFSVGMQKTGTVTIHLDAAGKRLLANATHPCCSRRAAPHPRGWSTAGDAH